MNMSTLLIAGAFLVSSAAANAGETGIINQAGPYEATMRFYLHPAHGFPGKAETTTEQSTPGADARAKPRAQTPRAPDGRPQPASQTSNIDADRGQQVANRERK